VDSQGKRYNARQRHHLCNLDMANWEVGQSDWDTKPQCVKHLILPTLCGLEYLVNMRARTSFDKLLDRVHKFGNKEGCLKFKGGFVSVKKTRLGVSRIPGLSGDSS
jgi:hypothetical protein